MKITTKNLSDTKVELTVNLNSEDLESARQKALARLAREVKVAGFRKGKVPIDVAEKNIPANDLSATTLDIAVRTSVPKAFAEAKKNPLMIPEVNVNKFVPYEQAEYTAVAEILPEIKLGNYKNLKVKKPTFKVTEKDIDDVVEKIRSAYSEKQVVKRKAQLTDEVVIDFTGKKDDVAFEGGSAKDFTLALGSGQFIPGFEEGIVGHESGERFDLTLTFPKDYHNKDLAGAKTVFNVLLKQVNEVVLPELNVDFAKKCGNFESIDALRQDIKSNLTSQEQVKLDNKYKDELALALATASKVSAPEILIKDQLRIIKDDVSNNAQYHGLTFDQYIEQSGQTKEEWEKEATKIAEQRVQVSLALQVFAIEEKITVEDELVEAKVAELKEVYKKSPEALANLKDPNTRQEIKNRLTIEQALARLVELNTAKK